MSNHVVVELKDRVLHLKLNRPEKKNALTIDMYATMTEMLKSSNDNPEVRCILFSGGEGFFTSGNDLNDFMQKQNELHVVLGFVNTLPTLTKPVIAAVDGIAIGIGTTLLLHADLVYATPRSTFKTPFVDLGLVPEAGSSVLLPAVIGPALSRRMLLLGEPLSAAEAHQSGLVLDLIEPEKLLAFAMEKAAILAKKAPGSIKLTKALLLRANRAALADTMAEEARLFGERLTSGEFQEAVGAFFQKRAPDFSKF